MRRTSALVIGLALTLTVGACGGVGGIEIGGGGGGGTTTTTHPRPTTSTTRHSGPSEPGGPSDPGGTGGSGGSGGSGSCEDPPVWAVTTRSMDEPVEPTDGSDASDEPGGDGCEQPTTPTPESELGTGDVQITLRWSSSADIDLHVFEPDGTEIWFGDPGPTPTGGQLDVDSNVGCEQEASVENVFWPEGQMPLGGYRVVVTGYQVDGCGTGDYSVTASVQGETVLDETGTVTTDEDDGFTFEAQ